MTHPSRIALLLGALALCAPCSAFTQTRPGTAPGAAVPAVATMTPERAALLEAQPTVVPMPQNAVGWIKGCAVDRPKDCFVNGGFSLKPDARPNLQLTIGLQSINGTRTLSVMLPLEVELRAGFTVALDNGQALLGDYASCSAIGCSGQVGLSGAQYEQVLHGRRLGLLVGNGSDKALRLDVSLAGFAATAAGPATSPAEMSKRHDAMMAKLKAASTGAPDPQTSSAKP